jgi:eukaryotic translation initiation factor 2C
MEPFNYRTTTDKDTNVVSYKFSSNLPPRPAGGNKSGKAIAIRVNQYKVTQFPNRDIYQYDVSCPFTVKYYKLLILLQIAIGNGAEKMGKIMAVWKSKTCQNKLREVAPQTPWLWNGNKLAW